MFKQNLEKKLKKKIWENKFWVKKIGKNVGKKYCEIIILIKICK